MLQIFLVYLLLLYVLRLTPLSASDIHVCYNDGLKLIYHQHLKCIVDVRIRCGVTHFILLDKSLMTCIYNYRVILTNSLPWKFCLLLQNLVFPFHIEPWLLYICRLRSPFLMVYVTDGHYIWKSETVLPLLSTSTVLWVLILSGTQVSYFQSEADGSRRRSLQALVTASGSSWAGVCSLCFGVLLLEVHAALPNSMTYTTTRKDNTQAWLMARQST